MRAAYGYAVAVRRADGSIEVESTPYAPLARRHPWLKTPVVRGAVGLFEMMAIGMKSLEWSANRAALDEPPAPAKDGAGKPETADSGAAAADAAAKPAGAAIAGAMALSLLFGIGLFVVLPNVGTHGLAELLWSLTGRTGGSNGVNPWHEQNSPVAYNLVSGAIRVALIVGYIALIGLMDDVKRLFRYHGAEHKAVSAFEAGRELTVENVRPFTRLHPRCGTTFIAITLLVSIFVFAFFARGLLAVWPGFADLGTVAKKAVLILGHVAIMPLVAGVCFELLRLGGRYPRNPLLRVLIAPGFWFQGLTVKEPDDTMIEVAIRSLNAALALPATAAATVPARDEALPAGALPAA